MSDSTKGVFCGNCGRELAEASDVLADQREPCPVCGSTVREFQKSGGSLTAPSVSTVASARRIQVASAPANQRPEAETLRGRYRVTLDWYELEGKGLWLLQVLNENGELVDGGVGDNSEDALLEVYERLVPPS